MEEWNTTSQMLDIALASKSTDPSVLEEWQKTIDEARIRQDEIKQHIDALIRDVMSTKTAPTNGLVVGRIVGESPMSADNRVQLASKQHSQARRNPEQSAAEV